MHHVEFLSIRDIVSLSFRTNELLEVSFKCFIVKRTVLNDLKIKRPYVVCCQGLDSVYFVVSSLTLTKNISGCFGLKRSKEDLIQICNL